MTSPQKHSQQAAPAQVRDYTGIVGLHGANAAAQLSWPRPREVLEGAEHHHRPLLG